MLFMLEYQINHSQKMDAFGAFASMSPDDDAAIEANAPNASIFWL